MCQGLLAFLSLCLASPEPRELGWEEQVLSGSSAQPVSLTVHVPSTLRCI